MDCTSKQDGVLREITEKINSLGFNQFFKNPDVTLCSGKNRFTQRFLCVEEGCRRIVVPSLTDLVSTSVTRWQE